MNEKQYTFTSAEFGPFSAVSTPIFASKYSFFSSFQDLQDFHNSAPLESQNFANFVKNFVILKKISQIFANFQKFRKF